MNGILKTIWDNKRAELQEAKAVLSEAALLQTIRESDLSPCRGFAASLRAKAAERRCSVIAEVKKASPSKGLIRPDFHPADIARSYQEGGAACLSVLTEKKFFLGSPEILREVRANSTLPVLRKDFILDPYQVAEARLWGADAVLLIADALSSAQMKELAASAADFGLDVLIESHSEKEIEKALEIPDVLIGINNRNLETFEVSLETTERLSKLIPEGRWVVTESGIHRREDVERMLSCGVKSFLVGEAFMRKENPGQALGELFHA